MAEIVNLRQARKRQARAEKETRADANRVAFGRPKAERQLDEARQAASERRHEGHRLTGREAE